MDKKILIWDLRIPLRNTGGPSGYLFQISQYLLEQPNDSIVFLSTLVGRNEVVLSERFRKISDVSNSYRYLKELKDIFSIYRLTHNLFDKELLNKIDFNMFSHIHFHVSLDFFNARELLIGYKGIVVLTSHSPEPLSKEITDKYYPRSNIISKWALHSLKKAELWAFENADKILFPVRESQEPYMKDYEIQNILMQRKSDLKYCPTAILDCSIDIDYVANFRSKYDIPKEAFMICYIGRHNEVKGYDVLQKIATELLNQNSNVYFIIAGNKGPIQELKHPRWIEIGWTNKSNEIIAASDLFILPNKDTYFDIVVLEVLRAGTPILMTLTGGNKYFKANFQSNRGIRYFEQTNIEYAIIEINNFIKEKENNLFEELRFNNRKLWELNFTLSRYITNYINIL